jgi:hypothetical protein
MAGTMLHVLTVIGLALALACGIYGLGDWLTQRGGIGNRWVYGWTASWWIIALSAQAFGPSAGAVFGAAATIAGLVRLARRSAKSRRPVLAIGAALCAGAPLWLAPPQFYDALVYHLGLPWSWLANGSFAPTADNLFSHFPLAASTVYLLPVAAGVPEAAAGLHWLTFAALLSTVIRLSRNLGAGKWSWTAALLFGATWHGPWLASLAGADHFVVLGVVVAAELWTAPGDSGDRTWVDAGVALGLALASKYTALVPVAALLVAAFALRRPRWEAIAAGAIAFATSSFWWIRNAATVGNPFHPLFWNWFGGAAWTAEDYARYTRIVQEGVVGWRGSILGVIHLATPSKLGFWIAPGAVIAGAAVFAARPASRPARIVAAAALLTLLGWSVTAQTPRYALPAAAFVAALAAAGLARVSPRVAYLVAAVTGLAAAHGLLVLGLFLFGTLGIQRTWLGSESRESWRHAVTLNDPAPAYRAADRMLPQDARILVVGEGRSWWCPRPHHVSSPYDAQWLQGVVERSRTAADVRQAVAAAGFTHLLFNWAELNRLGGDDYRLLRWRTPADLERYREFGLRFTAQVWADGPLELRVVRSGAMEGEAR